MCAFSAAFDVFRQRVITQVRTLFADASTDDGPLVSSEYRKLIYPAQTDELRACLNWLRDLSALTRQDMLTFEKLKGHRAEAAHLFLAQAESDQIAVYRSALDELVALLQKIEVWWATRVRSDMDTDSPSRRAHTAEHMQQSILTLKLLCKVADGHQADAWKAYLAYKEAAAAAAATAAAEIDR